MKKENYNISYKFSQLFDWNKQGKLIMDDEAVISKFKKNLEYSL